MRFAVLAKAVPARDELEFDPVRRVVRRDAGTLFLNPFDQRALRVALTVRRPGEPVTVVSLGPPAAAAVLAETLAVGADRAILITDPACAGSDAIVTAAVLAGAIRSLRADAVFAGVASTDGDTGIVPPAVAAGLGVPFVPSVRALERSTGPDGFAAISDADDGWSSTVGPAPVVIATGEKIAKPLKPTAEQRAGIGAGAVERWGLPDVGLAARSVGPAGSPTSVASVTVAAPARSGLRFGDGPIPARVAAALAELERRLAAPPPAAPPLPPPPPHRRADEESLVLTTGPRGRLDPSALGALVAVRRRSADAWPSALWIGPPPSVADRLTLARSGALSGYFVRAPPGPVDAASAATVVEELIVRRPELASVLVGPGAWARAVIGTVGGRRHLGVVADVLDWAVRPDGRRGYTKPSFGGRTVAEIVCRTRPELATVRPDGFPSPPAGTAAPLEGTDLAIPVLPPRYAPTGDGVETDLAAGESDAAVVVAFGMGIGGPDGIQRVAATVARWGAAVAATRRVVDAGWLPRRRQVGLTGRSLAPRLAVLLGISGSGHHLVGWRRAEVVLAVNQDPAAPVFAEADVGIVGSVEDVLPALDGPVARLLGR